jgi:hypothetical protein
MRGITRRNEKEASIENRIVGNGAASSTNRHCEESGTRTFPRRSVGSVRGCKDAPKCGWIRRGDVLLPRDRERAVACGRVSASGGGLCATARHAGRRVPVVRRVRRAQGRTRLARRTTGARGRRHVRLTRVESRANARAVTRTAIATGRAARSRYVTDASWAISPLRRERSKHNHNETLVRTRGLRRLRDPRTRRIRPGRSGKSAARECEGIIVLTDDRRTRRAGTCSMRCRTRRVVTEKRRGPTETLQRDTVESSHGWGPRLGSRGKDARLCRIVNRDRARLRAIYLAPEQPSHRSLPELSHALL